MKDDNSIEEATTRDIVGPEKEDHPLQSSTSDMVPSPESMKEAHSSRISRILITRSRIAGKRWIELNNCLNVLCLMIQAIWIQE